MSNLKKSKVFLLPMEDNATTLTLNPPNKDLVRELKFNPFSIDVSGGVDYFELYIGLDEKPKSGDWFIMNDCIIRQCEDNNDVLVKDTIGGLHSIHVCNKIIGTTNKNILALDSTFVDEDGSTKPKTNRTIYRIPNFFVNEFINDFNKKLKIDSVLIEYNEPVCQCDTAEKVYKCCYNVGDIDGTCSKPSPNNDFYGLRPKLDEDFLLLRKINESLEDAARRFYPSYGYKDEVYDDIPLVIEQPAFIDGAKWQTEQDGNKYTEDEVKKIVHSVVDAVSPFFHDNVKKNLANDLFEKLKK